MNLKRLFLTVGSALLLAALVFVALQGAAVLAQDPNEPGLIVFSSNRTGNYEIYVLDPQTGLMTQLTNAPGDDIEPQWSPNGEFIAFVSDRDGDFEVYVMRADGTDVRQLTNNMAEDRQPRWQPGGGHIVYISDVNGQWDMYVVSADGAIVRQLTNDMFDERGPMPEAVVGVGPGQGPGPGPANTPFPTLTPQAPAQPDAIVNPTGAGNVNVRAQPGTGAQIVLRLRAGDPVSVIAKYYDYTYNESWVQIRAADGTVGWVYEPILSLNISLANVPAVAAQFVPPPATPTPEPTAKPAQAIIEFWADAGTIIAGDCTNIHWRVEGIKEVYYQGEGVVGEGTREVCPVVNTTYHLRVIRMDDVVDNRYITITVNLP